MSDLGKIVLNIAREHFNCANKVKVRLKTLGSRMYTVYSISKEDKKEIIRMIFKELNDNMRKLNIKEIKLSNSGLGLIIKADVEKSFWYRFGLALSDGAVLSSERILFSSSNEYTINCIIYGFKKAYMYFGRYMVNTATNKIIPMFNIIVESRPVASMMKLMKDNSASATIKHVIRLLRKDKNNLCDFLAGVIDGDGSVDKDMVRISTSNNDPLYKLITELFDNNVKYDSTKFMIRVSTRYLRTNNILRELPHRMLHERKRRSLEGLLKKRRRIEIPKITISEDDLKAILQCLDNLDLEVIRKFKLRIHGNYTYLYISTGSNRIDVLYSSILRTLTKIEELLKVRLSETVKKGNREIVIYNQEVVKFLLRLIQSLEDET